MRIQGTSCGGATIPRGNVRKLAQLAEQSICQCQALDKVARAAPVDHQMACNQHAAS
jgi:hypothetical protein